MAHKQSVESVGDVFQRALVGNAFAQAQVLVESSKERECQFITELRGGPTCRHLHSNFCLVALRTSLARLHTERTQSKISSILLTCSSWNYSPISTKFLNREARPKLFVGVLSIASSYSAFLSAFPCFYCLVLVAVVFCECKD